MDEPVDGGQRHGLVGEDAAPVAERLVCRAAEPGKVVRDAGRGPAGHATIGSQLFSYVDSVGVKSADRADARQQLPINGNSTLVNDQEINPGKPPHQSAGS